MPRFQYKGFDTSGQNDTGTIEAADEAEAFALLQSRGLSVFELAEGGAKPVPWYAREVTLFGTSGHRLSDQAAVAELLGVLAGLGLPATKMIDIAASSAPTPALRRHLLRMSARIADGAPIAAAFDEAGGGFTPVFGQVLGVAEKANTLPVAMADLGRMLRRTDKLRGKVGSALVYPVILILAALVLIGIIAFFLAPALEPMFTALNKPMPFLLDLLYSLGQAVASDVTLIAPVLSVGLAALALLLIVPQSEPLRAALVRRLPLVGAIQRDNQLLRHVTALAMLLRGGLDLPSALETAAQMDRNSRYAGAFIAGADGLKEGTRATEAMGAEGSLPDLALSLMTVGEEANRLGQTVDTLSEVLEARLERRIDRAMQLLTPVLTVLIGGFIGLLVYSVMGAILDINTAAL